MRLWGYVEDIVAKEFHKDPQLRPIIEWSLGYNLAWLERNPTFFALPDFWSTINALKEHPNLDLNYADLPTRDGDIDWDVVAPDYFNYILSPFDPAMVEPGPKGRRNLLVDELLALPEELAGERTILDFGCGPGNLLPYLIGRAKHVVDVDKSERAIDIARKRAGELGINFTGIVCDFREIELDERFDLVIAVNSVLPQTRDDVVPILSVIARHLKPEGCLLRLAASFLKTSGQGM